MIRREIELTEGERSWLLISQVDHAHISGELTRHGKEQFPHEVIEAITHHDDGWADWETTPRINSELGGPCSFLEMPLAESLVIWDNSITAARQFGALAGFMVAGHFYNLLSESDHRAEPGAVAWLAAKRKARTAWLDEWVRIDPANSLEAAKRAQQQLFMADLFSLWLCCDAPLGEDDASLLKHSEMKLRAERLLDEYRFSLFGFGRRNSTPDNPLEALAWVVAVDPYPFHTSPLTFSLAARIVPAAGYANWPELKAASREIELRWRLMPPLSV